MPSSAGGQPAGGQQAGGQQAGSQATAGKTPQQRALSRAAGGPGPVQLRGGVQQNESPPRPTGLAGLRARIVARGRALSLGLAAACLLLLGVVAGRMGLEPPITQRDIDAAVAHSLETRRPVSPAVAAWEAIRPSVVRLRAFGADAQVDVEEEEGNVGTGVVIVDNGTILTNLHVVAGAERIHVEFADGHVSDAVVVALDPKQDLAVVRARSVPDDLKPATMRSTADLAVGDQVLAAGFPFDIGPSVSAGVVSGLRREFRSPEGQRLLTNLIQFDAAANPGNSGGPLVDIEGQVVGIVTAIMNPTEQRVFVGIGFAVPIENAATAAGMPPF